MGAAAVTSAICLNLSLRKRTDRLWGAISYGGGMNSREEQMECQNICPSSLAEFLQRCSWQCPWCRQTWVIFDTSATAQHICKRCGHRSSLGAGDRRSEAA